MLRSSSPLHIRTYSPAVSEISVGSPSPPLVVKSSFQPIDKRTTNESRRASLSPRRLENKSCADRLKSFSIADILGKKDDTKESAKQNAKEIIHKPVVVQTIPVPAHPLIPPQFLNERLQVPPGHLIIDAVPSLMTKVSHPWDPARPPPPFGLSPLFPHGPFLHYDQRLAWDYQRQLQEHFQVQAQLLREMSMDPGIIPSEDGSERSHSRSTSSNCYSPVETSTEKRNDTSGNEEKSNQSDDDDKADEVNDTKSQKTPNDTPLNALFQLSTKNFDEEQGKSL